MTDPKTSAVLSPAAHDKDPLWFKDAVIYELPVRAYADSDGDGIGDFKGLTQKLDYLQDLGVTAVWLLPFFPSPLRDDGYDISDYGSVNPIYGELDDFKLFLAAAHERGIRVIIELVMNHTSDQHPWFQQARRAAAGSPERDFYVWSDTPDKYAETRIIFQDFETSNWSWDPVAKAYYWHRFYSHQPDLNYDNPAVEQAMFEVVDQWLSLGVDGLRLDAVPYLYEREGSNCENLPETHAALRRLRTYIDDRYPDRMLLAEANQWPEDAVAYFGEGDECHMDFHFPLMPRLFMSVRMEDRFPIIDILQQTPPIPDNCQWAIFLRNHDELTLEMVTDEDRDYMYRMYAQDPQARVNLGIRRRLAPLLGNNRRLIELMNSLLFALPGTPVLYYGDEIGMGDNIYLGDRNGVRTPMQWSADRNAGFSRANPQKLYLPVIIDAEYHFESVNVEAQQENTNSLWWSMKRLIAVRKRYRALGRGTFQFLYPENRKVLAFVRTYEEEKILVIANLSRHMQAVELDLSQFEDLIPTDIFGRTELPTIGHQPYFFTLGPHSFYWFSLDSSKRSSFGSSPEERLTSLPVLRVNRRWQDLCRVEAQKRQLERILSSYLYSCRWFGAKARVLQSLQITEVIEIQHQGIEMQLTLLKVEYTDGDPQLYTLPLTYLSGDQALQVRVDHPAMVIAEVHIQTEQESYGILCDALADKAFLPFPLEAIGKGLRFKGLAGELATTQTRKFADLYPEEPPEPRLLRAEQSNSSVIYGDRYILKLYRKLEDGLNPDLEIGRYLTEQRGVAHVPPVAGALEYRREPAGRADVFTLGILQGFVPNEGDAWSYTLDSLWSYFEQVLVHHAHLEQIPIPEGPLMDRLDLELPELVYETIGTYIESARLLGQRTAELHVALAAETPNKDFAPESFSTLYQRSVYQSMRNLVGQIFPTLTKRKDSLDESVSHLANLVHQNQEQIMARFRLVLDQKINAMRTRCHGDYHLGQVLFTGKDFVIIDFEGEPARPLSERRLKRFPLRDVAGMLRSFHYAVNMALRNQSASGLIADENQGIMFRWGRFWHSWVCTVFMKQYVETAHQASFLPTMRQEQQVLLDAYLLEKAIYELGYELNNRPDWVEIPLRGILQLLEIPVEESEPKQTTE